MPKFQVYVSFDEVIEADDRDDAREIALEDLQDGSMRIVEIDEEDE